MEEYLTELIAAVLGGLMSGIFEFFPGVSTWYNAKTKGMKQLIIGAGALVISGIMFGVNCYFPLSQLFVDIKMTCDITGGFMMVRVVIAVVGGAQTIHITANKIIHMILGK